MSRERITPKASLKQRRTRETLGQKLAAANKAPLRWQSTGEGSGQADNLPDAKLRRIRQRSLRARALEGLTGSDAMPAVSADEARMLGREAATGAHMTLEEAQTAAPVDIVAYRAARAPQEVGGVPEVAPVPRIAAHASQPPVEQPRVLHG
ncbi:MAG TPA: hypothetical protein VIJ68_00735 [Candidatus Saccharimonadales bacterium]